MALECLCDFMSEPTFLVEIYVNYDCDVHVSRGVPFLWRWMEHLLNLYSLF